MAKLVQPGSVRNAAVYDVGALLLAQMVVHNRSGASTEEMIVEAMSIATLYDEIFRKRLNLELAGRPKTKIQEQEPNALHP